MLQKSLHVTLAAGVIVEIYSLPDVFHKYICFSDRKEMRKDTDSTKLIEQGPNQVTRFLSYRFWWMFGGEVRSTSKFCHSGPFPPNNFVTGRKERGKKKKKNIISVAEIYLQDMVQSKELPFDKQLVLVDK